MSYKHFSLEERYYIEIELRKGTSVNAIAKALNRPQGTVSKEINRNRGKRGYRHKQAHKLAQQRHLTKIKAHKLTMDTCSKIDTLIQEEQWSPEQIAGRLEMEYGISIHHETIYRYIYKDKDNGGTLHTHLRHYGKSYRKRNPKLGRHIGIPDRIDIDERPDVANNRERLGDWEADTMIGKHHKGAFPSHNVLALLAIHTHQLLHTLCQLNLLMPLADMVTLVCRKNQLHKVL